ncbi:MAG: thiol:disulfide interchange protein DsbA/DsbL [Azoarcus sp.]|jgi:thiol:disulfide interchange protein DsbA|nr:thiol:disulfide interchange protein DsbA/DsbL [Azoarcus sp.]
MNRRDVLHQLGALTLLAGTSGFALGQKKETFRTLEPAVPTSVDGKIEVLEFFHYGCPHCRDFEPLVTRWLKKVSADVVFSRVPAVWGKPLEGLAQLYYTLVVTKQLERLNAEVFAAVQDQQIPLNIEETLRIWVKEKGLDVPSFMDTYNSFGVQAQVRRAKQLGRSYKIDGVPTMAVAGRFVTSASLAGSHEAALREVDSLVARVRSRVG